MNYKNMTFISIGSNCRVSEALSRLGLRTVAYPFDWTLASVKSIYEAILNDFGGVCDNIKQTEDNQYHCIKYDIHFPHVLNQENIHKIEGRIIRMKKALVDGCILVRMIPTITDIPLEIKYKLQHPVSEDIEYLKKLNQLLRTNFPKSSIIVIHTQDIPNEEGIHYYKYTSDINPVCERQRQGVQESIKHYLS